MCIWHWGPFEVHPSGAWTAVWSYLHQLPVFLLGFNLLGQIVQVDPAFHLFVQSCREFIPLGRQLLQLAEVRSGGVDFRFHRFNLFFQVGTPEFIAASIE